MRSKAIGHRRVAIILSAAVTALSFPLASTVGIPIALGVPEIVAPPASKCPILYVLGIQGGDETSSDAPSTSDSGALGQLFGPLAAKAGDLVQRSYVPFGYNSDGTAKLYDEAITTAARHLEGAAEQVLQHCPGTQIAVAGYAHGAPAVSRFAERIGSGVSKIASDRVAGIALLANPIRSSNAPVIPGLPHASSPAPAPGTSGRNVATVSLLNPAMTGAGITASPRTSYGALTGRVADLCVPGDATCDAPSGGPLATTVANIAARSDLNDPVAAISTVAQALSETVYTTAVDVVNEDLHGTSLDQLSYQPAKPLGQRLAEASAPNAAPPGPTSALAALFRIGTIGFGAVASVAQKVITPQTVTELATVGMANPWAAIAALGAKIAVAVVELVPPQTSSRWINDAFDAITSTITDQRELYSVASMAQYSDTTGRHGSYRTVPATVTGRPPLAAVADWFSALAHDLATPTRTPVEPTNRTTTPAPTTTGRGR